MGGALPFVGAGLGVLGSMSSSRAQARQQREQVEAQRQQMEMDAQSLEAKAKDLIYEGGMAELDFRKQTKGIEGQIVTTAAGSGVAVNKGSVLDAIKENAYNIELDALTTRENYERQANAAWQQAQNIRAGKPNYKGSSGIGTLLGAAGAGMSGYATGMSLKG